MVSELESERQRSLPPNLASSTQRDKSELDTSILVIETQIYKVQMYRLYKYVFCMCAYVFLGLSVPMCVSWYLHMCVCVPVSVWGHKHVHVCLCRCSAPDQSPPYSLSSRSLNLGFPDWTSLGACEFQGSVCLPGPRLELTSELCLTFFFLFFFFYQPWW